MKIIQRSFEELSKELHSFDNFIQRKMTGHNKITIAMSHLE